MPSKITLNRSAVPSSTLRNMARRLVADGRFATTDIDRALGLPLITSAGFKAAATRYGRRVLEVTE